jgi:hypothetical protein
LTRPASGTAATRSRAGQPIRTERWLLAEWRHAETDDDR